MMRRPIATSALLVLGVALVAASCSSAQDIDESAPGTYTGADGVTSDISDTTRIITVSGDLTEIVFELGAGDSVVATDLTTVYPPEALTLPMIGIGRFLSAEAVLAQDPTIVIGDTQTAPQGAIDQIRAAGVPVVIFDVSTTFETLYDKISDLGSILGANAEADTLAARLRSEIESASGVNGSQDDPPTVAYVYTRGPDVVLLFGSDMVTQPIIEAAGAVDAGAAAGVEGTVTVTAEALIAAAPDVLVVPSDGLEVLGGIDGLLTIPGIAETPAGINRAILDYPEGDFLTIGPRIAETIAELRDDLAALDMAP